MSLHSKITPILGSSPGGVDATRSGVTLPRPSKAPATPNLTQISPLLRGHFGVRSRNGAEQTALDRTAGPQATSQEGVIPRVLATRKSGVWRYSCARSRPENTLKSPRFRPLFRIGGVGSFSGSPGSQTRIFTATIRTRASVAIGGLRQLTLATSRPDYSLPRAAGLAKGSWDERQDWFEGRALPLARGATGRAG